MNPNYQAQLKNEANDITRTMAEGNFPKALALADALIAKEPTFPAAWYLKGLIHRELGDKPNAITCFNRALNEKPDFRDACHALAVTLQESQQILLSIKVYEHLLKIEQYSGAKKTPPILNPNLIKKAEEWFYKGTEFQKNGDYRAAANAFRQMLVIFPDTTEALVNLGLALYHLGQYKESQETLMHCLRIKPGFPPALNILGSNYARIDESLTAIAAWRLTVASDPNHFDAWGNIGKELSRLELLDDSIKAYDQALRINPNDNEILPSILHLLHRLGRWDRTEEIKARMLKASNTDRKWTEPFFICIHAPELQLTNAKRYAARFFPAGQPYDLDRRLPMETRANGKLRIGYVSSDFNEHATAYLISEMFEQHDRNRFEIYAYSHGLIDNSAAQARIRKVVDQFHEVNAMPDQSAAELIRRHEVDIIVDLKGYTRGQRLGIIAPRPAPIQIHYLGYPGTMGVNFLDYFISDQVASPEGSDELFSEMLIRIPNSYQINDRSRPLPKQALPRSAYGLPEKGFVFCDFNNSYKITPEVFAIWMRLLHAVEGSVLWLYETYAEATLHMKEEAKKQGIDPNRIIIAKKAPLAEHLARYQHADLFIDTFPCGGHTTTSDALWCGVPVIAIAGKAFVSRVAASLLNAVKLPELITEDFAAYEALALALARDPQKLSYYRKHLQEGRMHLPLFDSIATTRAIEQAYIQASNRHRAALPPKSFDVDISSI